MTYKECSEKFPIGYSLGVFYVDKEQPTDFECNPTIEPGCAFWWAYNPVEKLFIFVSFIFTSVIGYKTFDGQNFMPMQKNLSYDNECLYEDFPDDWYKDGEPILLTDDKVLNLSLIETLFSEKMVDFNNYRIINNKKDFSLALLHKYEYGEEVEQDD